MISTHSNTLASKHVSPAIPIPRELSAVLGIILAAAVGGLLAVDLKLGVGALLGVLVIPLVLLNLPLGVAAWVPLTFIEAVPGVSLVAMGLLLVLVSAWISILPGRRVTLGAAAHRHSTLLWTLALLATWTTLSAVWASDSGEALEIVWSWYAALVAFLIVATTITRPRHLVLFLLAMIRGGIVAALVGFLPGSEGGIDQDGRLSGGLGDPNFLAVGLVVSMSLATGIAVATRSTAVRWSLIGTIGFLAASLAATGSRGGIIAGVASVVVALALARGARIRLGGVVLLGLALVGFWVTTMSPEMWNRIRDVDTQGTGRVDLWNVAWRMSEDNLILGVGANNFRVESSKYVREPGSPNDIELVTEDPHVVHNIYLQQLAETGVVGLALLAIFLALALRATWLGIHNLEKSGLLRLAVLGRAILVAQIGALSASIFLSNGYDQVLWILLALGPALTMVATNPRVPTESIR